MTLAVAASVPADAQQELLRAEALRSLYGPLSLLEQKLLKGYELLVINYEVLALAVKVPRCYQKRLLWRFESWLLLWPLLLMGSYSSEVFGGNLASYPNGRPVGHELASDGFGSCSGSSI